MVTLLIMIISIVLAVVALRDLENKSHIGQVKKKLSKGRVVFQDSSSGR
jgi:hypothetical protein